jgi:hypothetical protein
MLGIANIKGFFATYAVQVLGGALAVSLALNVGLGISLKHYIGQAAAVKTAVVAVNKAATDKKVIVEKRQEKNVAETNDRVTGRIAAVTDGLRRNRPKSNLPEAVTSPEGTKTEGGTTVFLPDGGIIVDGKTYYHDQEVCLTNTVLAEEWQTFYQKQVDIQEEENVGNTNP